MSVQERTAKVAAVVESLERDMELLCVTGVEDKLHDGVRTTLELLRNAGIKVFPVILLEFLPFYFVLGTADVHSYTPFNGCFPRKLLLASSLLILNLCWSLN